MKTKQNTKTNNRHKSGARGKDHWNWQGGNGWHYHEAARKIHDDTKCHKCGISIEEYKEKYDYINNFDMHCLKKDFRTYKKEDWVVVCRECHSKIHVELRELERTKHNQREFDKIVELTIL